MSKEFNAYLKDLETQEMLNENIRGSSINPDSRLEIRKESGTYEIAQTDAEKKINEAKLFSNPTENIPQIDIQESELRPNDSYNLKPSYDNDYSQENEVALSNPFDNDLSLDPEKVHLLESLNLNVDALFQMELSAEELGDIVNLKAEVDAALGLSPEDVDLNGNEDYSGVSPHAYRMITGRNLEEDIGIVDPANAQEVEIANGIYNRDTPLDSMRNELARDSKPDSYSPDQAWRSKYTPNNGPY